MAASRTTARYQDEWIYIIEGEYEFEIGGRTMRAGAGESVFLPRQVSHAWVSVDLKPGRIVNVYQPARKMEDFFRAVGQYSSPPIHEAMLFDQFKQLFEDHDMNLTGPPMRANWKVEEDGRMVALP